MSSLKVRIVTFIVSFVLIFAVAFVPPLGAEISGSSAEAVETSPQTDTVTAQAAPAQVAPAPPEVFIYPMSRVEISSPFGARRSGGRIHSGIDLRNPKGTPILASKSGTVTFAGWSSSYGNIVKIAHGNGQETYYAHLDTYAVKAGQYVKQGQQIGTNGKTGNATGYICHFEIRMGGRVVNPAAKIGNVS